MAEQVPTAADFRGMGRSQLTDWAKRLGIKNPQHFLLPELRRYVISAAERGGVRRF